MIPYTLSPGGSGFGLSHYEALLDCPRKAQLNMRAAENRLTAAPAVEATAVGTLVHAFLDLYDTRRLGFEELSTVAFGPADHAVLSDPTWLAEARRIFSWWRSTYQPEHFGTVLGCELFLEASAELKASLGVPPSKRITGRLDQVVRMSEDDCARLREERNLDVVPGVYIVDHKCLGQRSGFDRYVLGNQSYLYPLMWNETASEADVCQGVIYNFIIKTKTPASVAFLVQAPGAMETEILRNFFDQALFIEAHRAGKADPTKCFNYFRTCHWFTNGACARY